MSHGLVHHNTQSAGFEVAYHLTGLYPDWWEGRRFARSTNWWVACTNNETTRDNPQRMLLGPNGKWGTGTIPRSCIADKPTMSRGFPELVDYVPIRHVTGQISTLQFKAYDQGRRRWQGATLDGLWLDEEPPPDVYSEALARIAATGGMILMTMTPLLGMSEVVLQFYPEPSNPQRVFVMMDIEDAGHFSQEERQAVIDSYPEHEREARSRGKPMLGSGLVFAVPLSSITCESFDTPRHWRRIVGIDFGYGDHPFAAAQIAHDADADTIYLTHAYKEKQPTPAVHASALRAWGNDTPIAWPHDGHRQWGDSGPVAEVYRREGLRMLREHSTFPEGGYSPEAGVQVLLARMQTGRFKFFSHLHEFEHEVSMYHRKDGQLVKEFDDLISALRQAVMMLRFARVPPEGRVEPPSRVDAEWDPFTFEENAP